MRKSVVAMLLVLAFAASACGMESTQYNEVGLIYTGGVVQDQEYLGQLKPGATNNKTDLGGEVYRYPIDQRSWIGAVEGERRDAGPVEVVSADEQRMLVEYQLYFTLNQEEDILREFHENIGLKTKAWTPDGWTAMLQTYFAPQIERSAEAAALQFDWKELYASEEARRAFQADTANRLKGAISEVIGGDYFCGPEYIAGSECGEFTFTVGKPEPVNKDLIAAIEREQTAAQNTIAQEQENARITAELEARAEEVELYGPEVYAWLQAIEAAKAAGVAPPPFFGGTTPQPRVDVPVGQQ